MFSNLSAGHARRQWKESDRQAWARSSFCFAHIICILKGCKGACKLLLLETRSKRDVCLASSVWPACLPAVWLAGRASESECHMHGRSLHALVSALTQRIGRAALLTRLLRHVHLPAPHLFPFSSLPVLSCPLHNASVSHGHSTTHLHLPCHTG